MKTIIHVNQHNVRHNKKHPNDLRPPLTVKDYKQNRKGFEADILDEVGNVVATFVSRPEKPLSCGATVWVQTNLGVDVR